MTVKIVASGSSGNCAVINGTIVIDTGVKYTPKETDNLQLVLLTHKHVDHTRALGAYVGLSIASAETVIDSMEKQFPYTDFTRLRCDKTYKFRLNGSDYFIRLVRLQHDAACVGYDITCDGERVLFATDFVEILDEINLNDYTALYLECNNTLDHTDLTDIYFTEDAKPKDEFHRRRSYRNHCNADYLIGLIERSGGIGDIPLTLLHKSSYYYNAHPEKIERLCEIANVVNPVFETLK